MDQENELVQTENIINASNDENPIPQTQDTPEEKRENSPQPEDNTVESFDEKDTPAIGAFIDTETEDIFKPFQQKENSAHIAAPEEGPSHTASLAPDSQQRNPYGTADYGQPSYGVPQNPDPLMGDGNRYIPLRRENLYRSTDGGNNPYPTPNGYSAPIRENRKTTSDYVPGGQYPPTVHYPQTGQYPQAGQYPPTVHYPQTGQYPQAGQYPPVGNYPPAGSGISGGTWYPNGNYSPNRSNSPYGATMLPMPKEKKNRKPIASLLFGLLAMGVLNFFPFIALVLGAIALCTGYLGLKKGELTTGQRVCGFIGLALGIISLIISVSMLVMLMSLSIKASAAAAETQGSIYR